MVQICDKDVPLIDINPNEEDDSSDKEWHILLEINSDTEKDSSDDSDYEP